MNLDQIAIDLREEMLQLTDVELELYAKNIGVDPVGMSRVEIEDACIAIEQYAFTH